jgi:Na+-driven multidrug efflux pump
MLGLVRPDSWNLPLFLHVLGAVLTFGGIGTIAVLGFAAGRRPPEHARILRRTALWTGLLLVVPAFILMRAAAQWIGDKEFPKNAPGWVDVGFIVTEPGAILVLVMLILAWFSARRATFRAAPLVPWLASVYLVALGIAWFAMSAKPGS